MRIRAVVSTVLVLAMSGLAGCRSTSTALPIDEALPPPPGAAPTPAIDPDPWPRKIETGTATLRVYSPQVESWQGNLLKYRAAVAVRPTASDREIFGVIWGQARTEVNRETRMVSLCDQALTRSNFPTLRDNGASYLAELGQQLPTAGKTIALDRLQASLAASGTVNATGEPVTNPVPKIIVSYAAAILIPVDGAPALRKVVDHRFERVINSRALIVREVRGSTFYMHLYGGWLSAPAVAGPWGLAATLPLGLDELANDLAAKGQADLLNGGNAQPPPSLANGVPAVFVTDVPTELIVFKGQPELAPITGTSLLWCTNTTSDVIIDESNGSYYVLISGRWYQSQALIGPWQFVTSAKLPVDFLTIPPTSPAGVVLAAVAGTPQAREAVISNSIPQTASIPLASPPSFAPVYDGSPKLQPISGTPLQYIANSPTPIIRVNAKQWYALRAGVWFTAPSSGGPWTLAQAVPAVIYTIPPSSPLFYVTYVQIYGATPEYVYTGYSPGYLGTVVAPDGVVVYGTGYDYDPWIGSTWYAPPETYGIAAQPIYNPAVGWSYGYGLGLVTPMVVGAWGTPYYYSSAYHGYPCCGSASANVYGHYGDTSYSGTKTAYANSSGYGVKSSGEYDNERTGTTGSYDTNRNYNYGSNTTTDSASHNYDTAAGGSGSASRSASYDYDNGRYSTSSNASGTTASGSEYSHSGSASAGGGQPASVDRDTSVTSSKTGQTYSTGTGDRGNNLYASPSGEVHQSTADGWQKSTGSGWQGSSGDNSWANSEQQARSQSQNSFSNFNKSGGGGGAGGGGGGGWGSHFGGAGGGGGFGDRFGESGGGGFHGGGGGGRR